MMKKILTVLLAMAMLFGMASLALGAPEEDGWFSKWKNGSRVQGDISKWVYFDNAAIATTGNAAAEGNISATAVASVAKAKAADEDSCADNTSTRSVKNDGDAKAHSAPSDALNQANNSEEEVITETAESNTAVEVCIDAEIAIDGVAPAATADSVDGGVIDCCPAEVKGDIYTDVYFSNLALAETGDAYAVGNYSETAIIAEDKALACDGGTALNNSDITVTNNGNATAYSGVATATNLANNNVKIDIFRGALSNKTIDVFVEFLAG